MTDEKPAARRRGVSTVLLDRTWRPGHIAWAFALAVAAAVGLRTVVGLPAVAAMCLSLPVLMTAAQYRLLGTSAVAAAAGAVATGLEGVEARSVGSAAAYAAVQVLYLQLVGGFVVGVVARVRAAEERTLHLLRENRAAQQSAQAERQELDRLLWHRATHDQLTDLPNRAYFLDRVAAALADESDAYVVAVLLIDLDDFASVNDSLGHGAGDQLLVGVGRRLQGVLREGDLVARLGGDEFGVLLPRVQPDAARMVVDRVLGTLDEAITVEAGAVSVRASAGLVLASPYRNGPDHHEQALELLRQADLAMYSVKSNGQSGVGVYHVELQQSMLDRLTLEADLQKAVEEQQFFVVYQPIVDAKTGRIASVEALVRWAHPDRGVVPPNLFIPTAERSGVIVPIGLWVLRQACAQLRTWRQQRPHDDIVVAVNLSARQLEHPGIVDAVADVLYRSGVDPRHVVLEITESLAMADSEAGVQTLWKLRGLGVRLAVDDFGTGYSSLSRLGSLPVDEMKIDRSFVNAIGEQEAGGPIISAAVAMAHGLGLSVVAEGVETRDQLAFLQGAGCDYLQGYLLAKPVDADAIAELLGRSLIEPDHTATVVPLPRRVDEGPAPKVPGVLPSMEAPVRRVGGLGSNAVPSIRPGRFPG